MPDLLSGEYLHAALMEAGPVLDGMAITGLRWVDIEAWKNATGERLTPWGARALRQMSMAYADEFRRTSEDKKRPPPYVGPVTEDKRASIDAKIRAALGGRHGN